MRLGSTTHVQQCINELQDKVLCLGADRLRSQAVRDDSLDHDLPDDPPWPLQEGSVIREAVINHGSLATQRHVLQLCKSKGKGAAAKNQYKGKGKGPTKGLLSEEAKPADPAPSSTSTPTPPTASNACAPWRDQQPSTERQQDQHEAMADPDGPERGAKRPVEREDAEATQNQAEEDEFQEATRYRRGDGHLL